MITNALIPPNSFLKVYRNVSFSMSQQFLFDLIPVQIDLLNTILGTTDFFYGTEACAINAGVNPYMDGANVLLNSTKKAVIKISKHPSSPPQQYIAAYSLDQGTPNPAITAFIKQASLAQDGDEIEIYGYNEIRKFVCDIAPINLNNNPVPFVLTITLFN